MSAQTRDAQTSPQRTSRSSPTGRTRNIWWVLIAVCAVVLTGCGVRVGSELTLQEDFSGQRSWVVVFAPEEVEAEVDGGVEAAVAALEEHLPQPLEFHGLTTSPDDPQSQQAEFTMDFDSRADYRDKIQQLLRASAFEGEGALEMVSGDGELSEGIRVQESVTNNDLMNWMGLALVAEGVVPESMADSIFDSPLETRLNFDGQTYTSARNDRMDVDEISHDGFPRLELTVELREDGGLAAELVFEADQNQEAFSARNEYLESRIAQIQDLTGIGSVTETAPPGRSGATMVEFVAADAESLTQATRVLLNNEQLTFEHTVDDVPGSAQAATEFRGSAVHCDAICAPRSGQGVADLVVNIEYPETWELEHASEGTISAIVEDNFSVRLRSTQYVQELTVFTKLTLTGGVEQRLQYQLREELDENAVQEAVGLLDPGEAGTLSVSGPTVDVTLEGDNAQEFAQRLRDFTAGEADFSRSNSEGFFWPDYSLQMSLAGVLAGIPGGTLEPVRHEITLPPMHRVTSVAQNAEAEQTGSRTLNLESAEALDVALEAKGPTIAGLVSIVAIAILVLTVAVVIALILARRKKPAEAEYSRDWTLSDYPAQSSTASEQPPVTQNTQPTQRVRSSPRHESRQDTRTMPAVRIDPELQFHDVKNPTDTRLRRFVDAPEKPHTPPPPAQPAPGEPKPETKADPAGTAQELRTGSTAYDPASRANRTFGKKAEDRSEGEQSS